MPVLLKSPPMLQVWVLLLFEMLTVPVTVTVPLTVSERLELLLPKVNVPATVSELTVVLVFRETVSAARIVTSSAAAGPPAHPVHVIAVQLPEPAEVQATASAL